MSLPEPVFGLVIHYSYLWCNQRQRGLVEGTKERPCVIVIVEPRADRTLVTIAPLTHTPPAIPSLAVALPSSTKRHLGLDDQPSWVVADDLNQFLWPGFDLRAVPGSRPPRYAYGTLSPGLYTQVQQRVREQFGRGTLFPTER